MISLFTGDIVSNLDPISIFILIICNHLSKHGLILSKFNDLLEAQGVELAELPWEPALNSGLTLK